MAWLPANLSSTAFVSANAESEIWLYQDLTQMIPAHANNNNNKKKTTSVSLKGRQVELREGRGVCDPWVPNRHGNAPPSACSACSPSICRAHCRIPPGVTALREEGQSEDEEGVTCSTAPLPRMQCDTRHREMAGKVQGKNTVIYGSGICCQIRNRDLISGKSLPL